MLNSNIKKRETFTTFESDGRKFIINSFDPLTGNYVLVQCVSFIMPFGITDILFGGEEGSEMKKPSIGTSKMMSKEEFIQLEKDILCTIEEEYDSGNRSPVIRENGTFGVSDVNMGLVVKLIIASLSFNFKYFFDAVPSKEKFTELLNMA